MTEFVSEVKTIPFNEDRIFNMLSDLSNLGKVQDRIPQDKIQDFEFDKDSCSFSVAPVGKITFQIVEREPNKTIKFTTTNSPVPLFLWIQLKQVEENDTRMKITVRAELNPFISSKGYVAAGINYTLRTDTNNASVLLQSNEIKEAIPIVVEEAKNRGYNIDKMTVAGGSAGHALAMIYAYRDAQDAPVPVVFTFGAVGPSCFYVEDWGVYGLDQNTEESRIAAANLFSVMGGVEITPEEIQNGSYTEKMKPISAAEWVSENPIPTVVAYGTCDKVQPFLASLRLKEALEDNGLDYKYYELPHSGHGLQNDDRISEQWMESIDEYLNKYMPVN